MLNQIKRLSAIVNKLSGICEYVGKEDLLEAMSGYMAENGPYTLRTLQRDIKTIEEVFGMEIQNVKGKGVLHSGQRPRLHRSVQGTSFRDRDPEYCRLGLRDT